MKKASELLKSAALLALLLPSFLIAKGNHIIVGSEADPQTEIVDDFDDEEASEYMVDAQTGYYFHGQQPVFYPASEHWVMGFAGNLVEIEDGSGFECDWYDGKKVLAWKQNKDRPLVTITQNRSWFSSYNYRIINRDNNESIVANLVQGPFDEGEYTVCISIMDRAHGAIALTNRMELDICPRDLHIFSNWREGHGIIVGINSGWQSQYETLLINVEKNNFVRAKKRS